MSNRAAADIFAKTLLSDADMQRIVSCAAPIPLGKLHEYLSCREFVVISSIRSATAAAAAARIAELESQLAAEVERLDFVIGESAFIERYAAGSQLKAACQFGEEAVISGDGFHPTPRAAIDAARGLAKGGK